MVALIAQLVNLSLPLARVLDHGVQGARPGALARPKAGTPRSIERQVRLTRKQVAALIADHERGAPWQELAERYGIAKTTVFGILRRHRGGPATRRKLSDAQILEAQKAYERGDSLATIARRLGVGPTTVNRVLVEAGVQLRPRPGRQPV